MESQSYNLIWKMVISHQRKYYGAENSDVDDAKPYSAKIDFRRQNLTSKVDPRTARVK